VSDNNQKLPAISETAGAMPQNPRLWPVWLVLILVVLLIGALAFGLWEQYRQQQSLQDRFQQLSQQTSEVRESQSSLVGSRQERLNQFASQLEKQRETIEQQREKLNTQERQIEHNARSLLGLGKRTRTDWLLAEAEYLLRLANQRLQMERDHRGALRILETADEILAETDEAGVYPVRQQLAREILALRTLEPVDRTGLYLQLEAAMGMASELDSEQLFTADQTGSQSPANAGNQQTTEDGWRVVWQRVLNTLNQMVIIRRLDEPAQAMLSPQQSAQARLHLQLMFEQAAVALLQEDQSTYRRALRRAENWLDQWYDADDKRVETLQQLIDDAAEQRIRVTLPDISESLSPAQGAQLKGALKGEKHRRRKKVRTRTEPATGSLNHEGTPAPDHPGPAGRNTHQPRHWRRHRLHPCHHRPLSGGDQFLGRGWIVCPGGIGAALDTQHIPSATGHARRTHQLDAPQRSAAGPPPDHTGPSGTG
jgi:Uncharacterized enzyme of heme biosynthesis